MLGSEVLAAARRRRCAIVGMTTYTLESTRAICEAAEEVGVPVILQAGSGSFGGVGRDLVAAAALAGARHATTPVGVHLDHSRDVAEIRYCIGLGYTSVMVDGSRLAFAENVALTKAVVTEGHRAGVWVEAELGALEGNEESSSVTAAGELTDPTQAAEFVQETGVDALAVAIGNVHGFTTQPVRLDIRRLEVLAGLITVPLVLHGTSGLGLTDVTDAIECGVAKVNINAELRREYLSTLAKAIDVSDDDVGRVQRLVTAAMKEVAVRRLLAFTGRSGPNDGCWWSR